MYRVINLHPYTFKKHIVFYLENKISINLAFSLNVDVKSFLSMYINTCQLKLFLWLRVDVMNSA